MCILRKGDEREMKDWIIGKYKALLGIGIALLLVGWAFLIIAEWPLHLRQIPGPHNVAICLAIAMSGAILIGIGLGIRDERHKQRGYVK